QALVRFKPRRSAAHAAAEPERDLIFTWQWERLPMQLMRRGRLESPPFAIGARRFVIVLQSAAVAAAKRVGRHGAEPNPGPSASAGPNRTTHTDGIYDDDQDSVRASLRLCAGE